jgi:hypothetical protein
MLKTDSSRNDDSLTRDASSKIVPAFHIFFEKQNDLAEKLLLSHQFRPSLCKTLNQTRRKRRKREREGEMINLNASPSLLIIYFFILIPLRANKNPYLGARLARGRICNRFGAIDKPVASLGLAGAQPQKSRPPHTTQKHTLTWAAFLLFVAGLFSRIVLSSGSALSPWALQTDPFFIKRRVAEHTGCHGDLEEEDIAPCLRNLPLEKLLQTRPGPPR